jgi:uncharacterized protein involved in response to NO
MKRIAIAIEEAPRNRGAVPDLAELARLLAAAPHRLMFFAGATSVIVSMLWWGCVLAAARFGWTHVPAPPVPAGWAHAVLTQYGMLPMFVFGFLLTVFPRWMNQPALPRRAYVPVFAGVFGGYVVSHVGLLGHAGILIAGLSLMLAGWIAAMVALGRVLVRGGADRHALSCYVALAFGACGLAAFLAVAIGAPWQLAYVAIKLGTFALLLPIYFTVCHRMIPVFSSSVVAGYRVVRPAWSLPALWILALAHLALEAMHRYEWLWLVDVPLAAFFAWHWLAWQPWKAMRPGLLAALHLAFAWLPIAFGLFAAQSIVFASGGGFVLGRAPVHALTVGFFGSMLVAMVTRVTQGHSGRPLDMGWIAWLCFGALQAVAVLRIGAELASDQGLWLAIAAFAWIAAFLPWVVRALSIYVTPRADGKPG